MNSSLQRIAKQLQHLWYGKELRPAALCSAILRSLHAPLMASERSVRKVALVGGVPVGCTTSGLVSDLLTSVGAILHTTE